MGRLIRSRAALLVAVALLAALIGGAAVRSVLDEQAAEVTVEAQAGSLDRLCRSQPVEAARAGANCAQAAQIVRDGADGADGRDGVDGRDGRGVLRTDITEGGRLVVAYDDGQVVDVGPVVGADGETGPEGRGITGTVVTGGRLVVTYTDGEVADLGRVVGADGRGVASLDGSSGRLLVTLDDGEVIDAGPLPPGPAGPPGPRGEAAPSVASVTRVYGDGVVERCVRDGGPDTDPVFACERTDPPPPGPDEQTGDPPP